MPELGPAAAVLLSFIAAIASIVGIYAATSLRDRTSAATRRYPSLG